MRIIVHHEICQGHARCAAMAPDIFKLNGEGYILPGDIEIKPEDEQRASRGARACPERALDIEK